MRLPEGGRGPVRASSATDETSACPQTEPENLFERPELLPQRPAGPRQSHAALGGTPRGVQNLWVFSAALGVANDRGRNFKSGAARPGCAQSTSGGGNSRR